MDHLKQDPGYYLNIKATYQEIESRGPPLAPLAFPKATGTLRSANRYNGRVVNSQTGDSFQVENRSIILCANRDESLPQAAFWVGRTLKRCIYGVVKYCTVLTLRSDGHWEVTNQRAAVKILSKELIREKQHVEDPEGEISAMFYLSSRGVHSNVIAAYDVLEDEGHLMVFMPFCSSGDLLGYLNSQRNNRLSEPIARYWFRQLLEALSHLQRMGVCHRDISLENVMIDQETQLLVIDLGMCARIPYDRVNGDFTTADDGTLRRLIASQVPCGKPMYVAPEVVNQEENFAIDGFAVDLWSAGVVLFMMLTGRPAWDFPHRGNVQYTMIVGGALSSVVSSFGLELSKEATDLLQALLLEDPRQRMSMVQVLQHPWVQKIEDMELPPEPNEEWRG